MNSEPPLDQTERCPHNGLWDGDEYHCDICDEEDELDRQDYDDEEDYDETDL